MPQKVKNYKLINYENLLHNYTEVLNNLHVNFNLTQKFSMYINIDTYKNDSNTKYTSKNITIDAKILNNIKKFFLKEQEARLGYIL